MGDLTIESIKVLLQEQTIEIKEGFKHDLNDLVFKVRKYELKIQQLERRCLTLERKVRKNNVIIFGLEVKDSELALDTLLQINKLLGLNITINDVNNIYKIGKSDKPPIIIEFLSFYKKLEVFKNKERLRSLKTANVAISSDLCDQDRREQKILRSHLKKARENKLPAKIRGQRIEIQGKWYTASQLEQSDSEDEYETYGDSAGEGDDHVSLVEFSSDRTTDEKRAGVSKECRGVNTEIEKNKGKRKQQTPSPGLGKKILRRKKKAKY